MEGGTFDYPASGMDTVTDKDNALAIQTAIEFGNALLELERDDLKSNERLERISDRVRPIIIERELGLHDSDPDSYGALLPGSENVDIRLQLRSEGPVEGLVVILCQHFEGVLVSRSTGEQTPTAKGTVELVYWFEWEDGWILWNRSSRHHMLNQFTDCPQIDTPIDDPQLRAGDEL